jgi:enterochelin esterase-like enzyme
MSATTAPSAAGSRRAPRAWAPRRPLVRAVVFAAILLWLLAGVAGAFDYLERYVVYRGFPPPRLPAGMAAAHVQRVPFVSTALHRRSYYLVVEPPGYAGEAAAGRRFPVLYLLHGSPGGTQQFLTVGDMGVRLAELVDTGRMPPALLVIPAGLEGLDNDTEWANTPKGRYESYALEVVHRVDRTFPTLAHRADRVVAGMSEGGYAAVDLALHHLRVFGGAESWSGYYTQTPTGPFALASPALLREYSPTAYVDALAPRIHRLGLHAYLYKGTADSDPDNLIGFAHQLRRAGADVFYGFFPGGHDWRLWRAHVPAMMQLAGRWFEHPAPHGHGRLAHRGRPLPPARLRRALRAEARWRRHGGPARYRRELGLPPLPRHRR